MNETLPAPARLLEGHVAVVTGASRGVGRGIALGLADAGATVVVTGRTESRESAAPHSLPGTITDTAQDVSLRGGVGIAMRCDHADDADTERLFERVKHELGRVDILVNNAFAIPSGPLTKPFWELPVDVWDTMIDVGLRSHYVASVFAVRAMLEQPRRLGSKTRGLIVNVSSFGGKHYAINVAYGVGKAGVDRMTRDAARDLRAHDVAAVSIYPGIVRTERVVANVDGLDWNLDNSESPVFSGRAVAALATDPNVIEKSGKVLVVAELAREYGFTDEDGSLPASLTKGQ